MKSITAYLNFDGNARDAMTFYAACLGTTLSIQTFGESGQGAPGAESRVMHARLPEGDDPMLMASDTMPGGTFTVGSNFAVSVSCEDQPEIDRLFAAFAEGGTVTMALQDTFWDARFGMLTDRFGVAWMFNYQHPK